MWDSRDHIGKNVVVLYFYRSDFSFGCTRQALRYRDCQKQLADQGAEVVGISGDAVRAHRMFKEAHQLNFALLADCNGNVAGKLGVPMRAGGKAMIADADGNAKVDANGQAIAVSRNVTAARWTFIVGKDGRIVYREVDVSPVKDNQEVLEFLRKLNANQGALQPDIRK